MKSLKEFILKDNIHKYLLEKYSSINVRAVVYSKDNAYYYDCPYYIHTTTDNSSVKNNYKTWYLTKNSGETIDTINID
jgi:hypothetical protein